MHQWRELTDWRHIHTSFSRETVKPQLWIQKSLHFNARVQSRNRDFRFDSFKVGEVQLFKNMTKSIRIDLNLLNLTINSYKKLWMLKLPPSNIKITLFYLRFPKLTNSNLNQNEANESWSCKWIANLFEWITRPDIKGFRSEWEKCITRWWWSHLPFFHCPVEDPLFLLQLSLSANLSNMEYFSFVVMMFKSIFFHSLVQSFLLMANCCSFGCCSSEKLQCVSGICTRLIWLLWNGIRLKPISGSHWAA